MTAYSLHIAGSVFTSVRSPAVVTNFDEAFDTFRQRFEQPVVCHDKLEAPAFSLASYLDGHRRETSVSSVNGVALDLDQGNVQSATIAHTLAGLEFVAHTTFSSSPAALRWRIIIPTDRPHRPSEHKPLIAALAKRFPDLPFDRHAAGVASQCYALPCIANEGAGYKTLHGQGVPLGVDDLLASVPPPSLAPTFDLEVVDHLANATPATGLDPIARSRALFYVAVGLVRGFELSVPSAVEALCAHYNQRCTPPFDRETIEDVANKALTHGRLPFGALRRKPPNAETRAVAFLERAKPAVSGQRGHFTTFRTAALLRHFFGLSEAETLRLMRVHYNHRCNPPWSDWELARKVREASKAHKAGRGLEIGRSQNDRT